MPETVSPPATARLSIAFLAGAVLSAVASVVGTLAIVPEDLPGRMPSASELAVLALWVLALGFGHRWATRRHADATPAATLGTTVRQVVWGGAAFLLLAALALLVAPLVTAAATRLVTATALANAHLPIHVLLLIPMGLLLALGTGAATGSLVRPRR
jgi:hypothetical protein